jgi:precorrin-6B methylase 2
LALAARVGPTGKVVGVEVAAKMLDATRRKAAALGLANVETHEPMAPPSAARTARSTQSHARTV